MRFLEHSVSVSPEENSASLLLTLAKYLQHSRETESHQAQSCLEQMTQHLGFSRDQESNLVTHLMQLI